MLIRAFFSILGLAMGLSTVTATVNAAAAEEAREYDDYELLEARMRAKLLNEEYKLFEIGTRAFGIEEATYRAEIAKIVDSASQRPDLLEDPTVVSGPIDFKRLLSRLSSALKVRVEAAGRMTRLVKELAMATALYADALESRDPKAAKLEVSAYRLLKKIDSADFLLLRSNIEVTVAINIADTLAPKALDEVANAVEIAVGAELLELMKEDRASAEIVLELSNSIGAAQEARIKLEAGVVVAEEQRLAELDNTKMTFEAAAGVKENSKSEGNISEEAADKASEAQVKIAAESVKVFTWMVD